ncbi:DNA replication/repair protein RecF [Patescibacteria group bacterium]
MVLRSIKLTNFRNLNGEYALSKGINVIIGANGLGKTNFLESTNFLSYGKSFRTNCEANIINTSITGPSHLKFMRISGNFVDSLGSEVMHDVVLENTNNGNGNGCRKTLKKNNNKTPLSKFLRDFHTIIFSPNTIDLVISSPSVRRRDIDDFLSIYDRDYFTEITEYKKVIRNRNRVLESVLKNTSNRSELSFWNKKLIDLGAIIIYKRINFVDTINPLISKLASKLFNSKVKDLEVKYISKFVQSKKQKDIKNSFKRKIEQNIDKEIFAGTSLYGPQREDFYFLLNSYDLKEFGSRGQQRLCSFLYKIAQYKLLKRKTGSAPMLLLDDLFSELDRDVRTKVCSFLIDVEGQTILTAVSEKEFDKEFLEKVNRVEL